jgi:oxygen-independent coproporphyrinogen-3 oxidase
MNCEPPKLRNSETLSLYIHWPFCLSKCPYCDFNSHVRTAPDGEKFKEALLQEMRYGREFSGARQLTSIFFGGGTPSLMQPQTVAELIDAAAKLWSFDPAIEITLEANPTSSEANKFKGFREAGVNRMSLGVQSLRDAALKNLGRHHSAAEAIAAVQIAARIFPRFSFDLIYARKNQSVRDWEMELKEALALADGHLSLYQLTLEPGTLFAKEAARGAAFQAPEAAATDMYELTGALTKETGLPLYEISNYASPGNTCRHNLTYWNYGDYVGIGPGAHGRVSRDSGTQGLGDSGYGKTSLSPLTARPLSPSKLATQNLKSPEAWLKAVGEKSHGLESATQLEATEMRKEALLMGLRLADGIVKGNWRNMFDETPQEFLDAQKLDALKSHGLLEETATHLRATPDGLLKLNALLGYLLN